MASITLSSPEYFRAGVSGVSAVLGYESGCNRVARYRFTAPDTGASSVSLSLAGLVFGDGTRPQSLRFYIGTDPNSHSNAGASTACTGILTTTPTTASGSASCLLLPKAVYYLFLFPNDTEYGWYSMELATVVLGTSGGSCSKPTLSAASIALGGSLTIKTNRASTGFTHYIGYSFGGASGTIATGVGDSCTWTPPLDLARQIPNSTSGVGTISCITYNGSTLIGTAQVSVTLTVPDSVVPTVRATWEDTAGALTALGTLVQRVSALKVAVSASGAYGSTVVSTAVTLGGKAYTGGALMDAGSLPLVITARDSRGRTGKATYSLAVAAYTAPALTLSAHRCTQDGTADDGGAYAHITVACATTALSGNTAALTLTWGSETETVSLSTGSATHSRIVPADTEQSLSITARLSDKLCQASRSMTLSTAFATLDLLKGGKGIAFGAVATREGFQCAMDAWFSGQLYRLADGEKEWFFPPLELGVEYRTCERLNGKPVYVRRVKHVFSADTGTASGFHAIVLSGLLPAVADVREVTGYVKYKDVDFLGILPYMNGSGGLTAVCKVRPVGQVEVHYFNAKNSAGDTLYLTVKYTKEEL